ncbi:transforming growth factor-beta receptor-associated protein 1 [Neosynchiropus ocellatus]
MAFKAFTQTLVYEKQVAPREKNKSSIQCLECCEQNVYFGTKDGSVQHLILSTDRDSRQNREGRLRKLGSNQPVVKLRAIPVLNHLLVLSDRSLSALNMFSLDPIPALKKIQQVSLFETSDALLVTASNRKKVIQIYSVTVDRWDVVKEIPLGQDALALATDGTSLCVATLDKYLLCDLDSGSILELFPHHHSRQQVIATSVGGGEFLLNGPRSLGVFVMKTGICQRPPLQWPEDVLAVGVCLPYILTLQPRAVSVYSLLDRQHKQTVSLSEAAGLSSTSGGVFAFTDREVFRLRQVPLEDQIQALVRHERAEEALLLLDAVQTCHPVDSRKELQKSLACLAGFHHFHQERFSEAKDLFIQGKLDPREIIHLYSGVRSVLLEDFRSEYDQDGKGRGLQARWRADRSTLDGYLTFLGDFLSAARGTEAALQCSTEVDSALLRLYAEQGDSERLQVLASSPNSCSLDVCGPVLEEHDRYFALGLLYQSHGKHRDALEIWMKMVDGDYKDPSSSDVYGHMVRTLTAMEDRDTVWMFADWILLKDQEIGAQIFMERPDRLEAGDVLDLLEKYPLALTLYLEFLIVDFKSEEETHHSRLALAYVSRADLAATRDKLQLFLWDSTFYSVTTVYERVKETSLHLEKAILMGKTGQHSEALQMLLRETGDPQVAEFYCLWAAQDRSPEFRTALLLDLLQLYVTSGSFTHSVVDLLHKNLQSFPPEEVIRLLPDSWSVQLLSHFLVGSLRETAHQRRMTMLQRSLSQVELLRHKAIWMETSKHHFSVDKLKICQICQRDFSGYQFVCNPQGEVRHSSCRAVES